ncbi:hypothetical protein [Ruegeria jejuensis]|uniref:hypothetical protein n=1 Tax=Ruegeria jejuensis TaxID=3233338 RepID=UPI00355BD2BF
MRVCADVGNGAVARAGQCGSIINLFVLGMPMLGFLMRTVQAVGDLASSLRDLNG